MDERIAIHAVRLCTFGQRLQLVRGVLLVPDGIWIRLHVRDEVIDRLLRTCSIPTRALLAGIDQLLEILRRVVTAEREYQSESETLHALGEIGARAGAPTLPDEALTRKAIYADRD